MSGGAKRSLEGTPEPLYNEHGHNELSDITNIDLRMYTYLL
jgi:hypothetical protein